MCYADEEITQKRLRRIRTLITTTPDSKYRPWCIEGLYLRCNLLQLKVPPTIPGAKSGFNVFQTRAATEESEIRNRKKTLKE